jgi:hypothetical protein
VARDKFAHDPWLTDPADQPAGSTAGEQNHPTASKARAAVAAEIEAALNAATLGVPLSLRITHHLDTLLRQRAAAETHLTQRPRTPNPAPSPRKHHPQRRPAPPNKPTKSNKSPDASSVKPPDHTAALGRSPGGVGSSNLVPHNEHDRVKGGLMGMQPGAATRRATSRSSARTTSPKPNTLLPR